MAMTQRRDEVGIPDMDEDACERAAMSPQRQSRQNLDDMDRMMISALRQSAGIDAAHFPPVQMGVPTPTRKPKKKEIELCLCTKHLWS